MYPHERSLVKRLNGEPFVLIGVNSDDDREKIEQICKDKDISWRSFWDGGTDGPIATAWNVYGWPTTYVLDAKGMIRFKGVRGKALDAAVDELISQMEK